MVVARLYQGVLRNCARLFRARNGGLPGSRPSSSSAGAGKSKPPERTDAHQTPATSTETAQLPIWERLGPLTRTVQAYGRAQRKRPYVVQVCSAMVIYLCADVSAQRIRGKEYDPARSGRSLIIGAVAAIPAYRWFVWLSTSFNYSSKLLALATRVVVNQACFTPVFNTYFFGMQALLAGEKLPEIWKRLRHTVPVSVVNSLKLWPAVTAFAFTFIPLEYRSIFVGFIAVGWQTYLAYLNRLAEERENPTNTATPTIATVAA